MKIGGFLVYAFNFRGGIPVLSMGMIFSQIAVIFGYVLVGFAASKLHIINAEQRKYLTRLCSDLILPFTILSATSLDVGGAELAGIGIAAALMFLLMALSSFGMLGFSRLLRRPAPEQAALTSLITYPNATFLGLPLCRALFGDIAILYNASIIIAFNVLFFTLQYSLFTGKGFRIQNLITAPTLSTMLMIVMLALGVHFPTPVQTVVANIGAMITPLSLMIIGVMVAESDLAAVLKEKRAYLITLMRNFLLPLIAMALLALAPLDSAARMCVLVYLACPCATLTIIYAIQSDSEPQLCANTVLLSTLTFALSLPCIIALGQRVLM